MSTFAILKNTLKISPACAQALAPLLEERGLQVRGSHLEFTAPTGNADFMQDKHIRTVLLEHEAVGRVCFVALNGPFKFHQWGYELNEFGDISKLCGDTNWQYMGHGSVFNGKRVACVGFFPGDFDRRGVTATLKRLGAKSVTKRVSPHTDVILIGKNAMPVDVNVGQAQIVTLEAYNNLLKERGLT